MMETKLLAALCALLVLSLGSADHHEGNPDAGSPTSASNIEEDIEKEKNGESPSRELVPDPGPDSSGHAQNNSDINPPFNATSNTTAENLTVTITPREENATTVSPVTAVSHENESSTTQPPSQPPAVPSESHSSTPHPVSVTTALTTPSSNNSKSNHSGPVSTTKQPTETEAPSSTSTQTPEEQKPETSSATTATTTALSGSASSAGSSHTPTASQPSTITSQSSTIPLTSTEAHLKASTTSASPSGTSIQARTHPGSPSQLNMGGDSAHGPTTLDPLLAGLVSAFILTAVVITLLLFLKLRRRNNRPEFRRLQDLPMDDMMEDTPLSMYSY
ncbi:mucin-2-like [Cololabis saira]|uniref:mucin-2-like n=1 Tax=Cololabis saira TaxID=129043 RepID=UPI002AD3A7A5|nr:mucin-2-like [Cololabis saira]